MNVPGYQIYIIMYTHDTHVHMVNVMCITRTTAGVPSDKWIITNVNITRDVEYIVDYIHSVVL